jgi:hypothetical protein
LSSPAVSSILVAMLILLLKALYFVFLIVFFYARIVFTAIASFLKVTFFGI